MIDAIRSFFTPESSDEPVITFTANSELYGAIPEPTLASKELPDWYRDTPIIQGGGSERTSPDDTVTVRGCIPFLEGMTSGWIMKTPVDIYMEQEDGMLRVTTKAGMEVVNSRSMVEGIELEPTDFPLSINTYWSIKTAPGYSAYTLPLLNRFDKRFRTISGLIESDSYQDEHKVELIWRDESYSGVIPAGTPISQVVPVKRTSVNTDGRVRCRTEEEQATIDKNTIMRHNRRHYYKNHVWSAPDKSKLLPPRDTGNPSGCPFRPGE